MKLDSMSWIKFKWNKAGIKTNQANSYNEIPIAVISINQSGIYWMNLINQTEDIQFIELNEFIPGLINETAMELEYY